MLSNALTQVSSWEEKALRVLADIFVCKRCVVRIFRGSYGDYSVDETETTLGAHCFTCLGILEGSMLVKVGRQMVDTMESAGYDCQTFRLGISLPQCLVLRHASIMVYLTENSNGNIMRDITTVKNVLKVFLAKYIERHTNKRMEAQSPLFLKLDFRFKGDKEELLNLNPLMQKKSALPGAYRLDKLQKLVRTLSDSELKKYTIFPPKPLLDCAEPKITVNHSSIYVGGRYNISPTAYFCVEEDLKKSQPLESIGECVRLLTRGTEIRFHAHNRHDHDLGVLGEGLPFAIEITDPKLTLLTPGHISKVESDVNSSMIQILTLRKVTKQEVEAMKKWELENEKLYSGTLMTAFPVTMEAISVVNQLKDFTVVQKVPIQFLNYQNSAKKNLKIQQVEVGVRSDGLLEFQVQDSSGVYIKEFIHGDFGRTEPSLSSLLDVPFQITSLNVSTSKCNWPPPLET